MSAKIESPESLDNAVRYALGLPAGAPSSSQLHNVGACAGGCGGGGALGGGACGCNINGRSPGAAAAMRVAGNLLAPFAGDFATLLGRLSIDGGVPSNIDKEGLMTALSGREACEPYRDMIRDCLCMVELPSQRVVAPAAGTVTLTIQPQSGWFFAYYFDINVNRPGVAPANPVVPPGEYLVERPRVRGCPTSPCIPPPTTGTAATIPMSASFMSAPTTCSGCGRPFIAVIPNASNATPLDINVSGLALGDVAQAVVRGFCFDTRICC